LKVKLARTAGFCMGVRRAMELVLTAANQKDDRPLYTYGPLIHNTQVLDLLKTKSVTVLKDLEGLSGGRIVIRAHGIPPAERARLKETGMEILDATCPKVARVQSLIRLHTRKGHECIIVGDSDHAEVIGLMGYSVTPPWVIQVASQVAELPDLQKPFVVAQTTQNDAVFGDVVAALKARFPNLLVFDTICNATHLRQKEVRSFKDQVDAMVVVGGYHSGNTQRLAEVARESGLKTFHVETEKDLDLKALEPMSCIGVTAGASTPNWMIQNVVRTIERVRGQGESSLLNGCRKVFESLVLASGLVAGGAFCFAYAAGFLAGPPPEIVFPFIAMLYLYAVHGLNRIVDKGAGVYNDPEGAEFLTTHRGVLLGSGVAAAAAALLLALTRGLPTFLALAAFIVIGLIYSLPIFPDRLRSRRTYFRIKDIPGSRSLADAFARVAVINILPLFSTDPGPYSAVAVSMVFVLLLSYGRSGLFDLLHLQGDLIVGKETLPLTIGQKQATLLLRVVLGFLGVFLVVSGIAGWAGAFAFWMLIPVGGMILCLAAFEKRWIRSALIMEALVESNFFLAGIIAFCAYLFR